MTEDELAAYYTRRFAIVGLCMMAVGFIGASVCMALAWWLS